jgi:hypothetical protein
MVGKKGLMPITGEYFGVGNPSQAKIWLVLGLVAGAWLFFSIGQPSPTLRLGNSRIGSGMTGAGLAQPRFNSVAQIEPATACPKIGPVGHALTHRTPTISAISFATRQDDDGWPLDPALQFTSTITRVLATFSYAGLSNGLTWERVWLFGNEELSRHRGIWDAGPKGKLTIQAGPSRARFAPGRYTLEVYVAGQPVTAGAFLVVAEGTPTQRPVQVAYTTWDGAKHRLYRLDLVTNQSELLVESAHIPAWSSDAEELLFYGERGIANGAAGLWRFNMNQRKSYQLNKEISFQSMAWSPHRSYVAVAQTTGAAPHLVVWNIDQNLAFVGPPGADPVWSPEGLRLAFQSCDDQSRPISTIRMIGSIFDTGNLQHLTNGDDRQPAWSWDGQWIAFVRREGDNQDIYMVRADGSDLTRLTDHPAVDTSPAWTPDQHLLFRSLRDGRWGIYIMNPDGSDQRQLVSPPSLPDWQPDRLAVSSDVLAAKPPQPRPQIQIPAEYGLLAVSNKATSDELIFTIDNVEHKIGPYQLRMLILRPGHYTWTASWPGQTGRSGFADIAVGQVANPVVER